MKVVVPAQQENGSSLDNLNIEAGTNCTSETRILYFEVCTFDQKLLDYRYAWYIYGMYRNNQ